MQECSTLQRRLEESGVNFLVAEEDKLVLDTSPSDASDLLTTSDNRIGLLLAEVLSYMICAVLHLILN